MHAYLYIHSLFGVPRSNKNLKSDAYTVNIIVIVSEIASRRRWKISQKPFAIIIIRIKVYIPIPPLDGKMLFRFPGLFSNNFVRHVPPLYNFMYRVLQQDFTIFYITQFHTIFMKKLSSIFTRIQPVPIFYIA